jgi:hypothetical protein
MSEPQNDRENNGHFAVGAHVAFSVADVMAAGRVPNSVEFRVMSQCATFTRRLGCAA